MQDHARVEYSIPVGQVKRQPVVKGKALELHQKLTMKQWQGVSHKIDPQLRALAKHSLERITNGGDVDLERKQMIKARIQAVQEAIPEKSVMAATARLPFRSYQQQSLLRTKCKLEAAMREVNANRGMTPLQIVCIHDLGITAQLRLSREDQRALVNTQQWIGK